MKRITRIALPGAVACWLTLGCGGSKPVVPKTGGLVQIESHPLTIAEPSGLTINESGTVLWTVGNQLHKVYQLDLRGNPTKVLNYVGEDVEGVEYDPSDATLWVVEERRREVVHLDLNGDVLGRQALAITGDPNSGLEGICLDAQGRMFVVNQKDPKLFVSLNPDLSIAGTDTLTFAENYSGLAFSRGENAFWMLSGLSRKLYLWSKASGVIREYALPFAKPEGVAFNEAGRLMYVVSDSENRLYVFRLE